MIKLEIDMALHEIQNASSFCANHKKDSGECVKDSDNGSIILIPTFSSILAMLVLLITLFFK